ncbi:MAG: guanosine-3',5'-bis(diphosphate) 3'-pyrophosphohydrolase [Candidatus Parcubacteria bacterium]|nr:MAG: guanosine-3',5'-bis(diphosphate) 3'-pyrophosphohydrolase [Candidatus Parcubacteria bacterium]
MDFENFKNKLISYNNYGPEDLILIERAFYFGEKIYQGIKRKNGEPYLNHCLRTALNLAELKLSKEMIIAGILHDALKDGNCNEEKLKTEFGEEITFLVKGVNKIGSYRYQEKNLIQAENLRNLILAIIKDPRIVVIKLADRLDNMRTLEFLSDEKRKRISLETADIYAPLALRLGINNWAGELDDLALKFLDPENYNALKLEIEKRVADGKSYLEKLKTSIERELKNKNINLIKIDYRVKRISSVYKKLPRKNFDLDQIYDLLAFRIIVNSVENCYLALGVIHSLFKPLMHEFDDYIAFPKPNGYRSLHTTVITEENKYIEFQIRTEEMHLFNEYGLAAYLAYAKAKQTKIYQKNKTVFADEKELKIINNLKNWQENFQEIFSEKIYVLTPKGDVIELPAGSTPLDFAYKIHTDLGNHFVGARVNQKIVPINYKLQNGDVIEIIVNKNRKPSPDWLSIVKSANARKKIKAEVKKENIIFVPKIIQPIKIIAQDRIGILKDITNLISSKGINIIGSKNKSKKGLVYIYFDVQVNEKKEIIALKDLIKNKIKEVVEVE